MGTVGMGVETQQRLTRRVKRGHTRHVVVDIIGSVVVMTLPHPMMLRLVTHGS